KNYGKAVPYFHENIQKIRMTMPKENSLQAVWENSPWVVGGERIEFDYLGKVIRLGRKVEEKEAKILFQMMTKRIDQHLRKAAKRN
ncbi:MAG: hypothetical protein N4A41_06545, partial [Crocinitomicaceae bacterium]|nr:hypothetical protein [Crocinitomicaceae bacterium]